MPSKLIEAVRTGNLTLVRAKLEAGRNPNQLDEHKNPLIHYPIIQDDPEMLQLLLEYGADPNLRWKKDIVIQKEFTPLHVVTTVRAADKKRRKTILDLLVAYGADPAALNTNGRTALNVARNKTAKKYLKKLTKGSRKNKSTRKNNKDSIMNLMMKSMMVAPNTSSVKNNIIHHDPTMNKIITITERKKPTRGTQRATIQVNRNEGSS